MPKSLGHSHGLLVGACETTQYQDSRRQTGWESCLLAKFPWQTSLVFLLCMQKVALYPIKLPSITLFPPHTRGCWGCASLFPGVSGLCLGCAWVVSGLCLGCVWVVSHFSLENMLAKLLGRTCRQIFFEPSLPAMLAPALAKGFCAHIAWSVKHSKGLPKLN